MQKSLANTQGEALNTADVIDRIPTEIYKVTAKNGPAVVRPWYRS